MRGVVRNHDDDTEMGFVIFFLQYVFEVYKKSVRNNKEKSLTASHTPLSLRCGRDSNPRPPA